jgi:hypothetical protein
MSEIFISYARSTEAQAVRVVEALRALGYGVWRDDERPAHRAYTDVLQERLAAAKAVVVIWSADEGSCARRCCARRPGRRDRPTPAVNGWPKSFWTRSAARRSRPSGCRSPGIAA